jgi:hypothetical protein
MKSKTFRFSWDDLKIDLSQIERVLGYREGNDREIVNYTVAEILKDQEIFRGIKAEYRIFTDIRFVDADKSLEIGGVKLSINKTIYTQIKRSGTIAIFLATAGEQVGQKARKAMTGGDPLTGYITDMLGSLIADSAAELIQADLEKDAFQEGQKISNQYSPGYCGWETVEQHRLFSLMPANFCGIRLTESALMEPVKSISGIIGIGEKVRFNPYRCNLCDMVNCAFRETRVTAVT